MSSHVAITVRDLTKVYKLYDSPQDRLKESINPFGRKYHRDFYALNGVSFEIKKGETVGIVGKNGCGKSTLLKTITGVLTPTSGSVSVDGKISALLELGAGFNPQLTGLENVYFNGTILGYTRAEIDQRLDDILSFADIGNFLHQPVKTYSSGMFVRLAFAVAINVDPEILIVDEALSVGDEAFQRKCFSRIIDFKQNGKTILFVSHSAGTIIELCDKAMLFEQGELLLEGAPKPVVTRHQKLLYAPADKYRLVREEIINLQACVTKDKANVDDTHAEGSPDKTGKEPAGLKRALYDPNLRPQSTTAYESRGAFITAPHITSLSGEKVNLLLLGEEYIYTYTVYFEEDAYQVRFGMLVKTTRGFELGGMTSHPQVSAIPFIPKGTTKKITFGFKCALLPGAYFLNAGVLGLVDQSETYLHRVIDAFMFRVQDEEKLISTGIVDFSTGSRG